MRDYSGDLTDEKLAQLERRIAAVYKQARDDLDKEVKDYFAKFEQRDAEMRQLVEAGEFSREEYKQWRMTQMGRGSRFEALRDRMAERFTHSNEVALSYVNYLTPEIYCENRNFEAYKIEHQVGDCGFPYWDTASIPRLLVEEPDVMPYYPPERALRRGIDLAYGKDQITKRVTSGILRGLSPGKIAAEMMQSITGMSRESALRAARTGITAAQNAGRMDSYVAAQRIGIHVRRLWVATKAENTRDAHALADGQTVEGTDTPFEVGGEKLMFPGDTSRGASGWNIYNCRCSMRTVEKDGIEAEPRQMRIRNPVTGKNELVSEMTYSEWMEWKLSASKGKQMVEIPAKSAIMKESFKDREETAVHQITRLDIEKYRCVSDNITTDEVIITDERIQHIRERHPNDFERYEKYLAQIIEEPDYLLRDKMPNTAMVLKQFEAEGERFRMALRLTTPQDNPEYKNSILTFLKIREKEWNRLIKNKDILYKAE